MKICDMREVSCQLAAIAASNEKRPDLHAVVKVLGQDPSRRLQDEGQLIWPKAMQVPQRRAQSVFRIRL